MARIGPNIRSVAPVSARERIHAFWVGVLRCQYMRPRDDLDVYVFEDGSRLGVYFVSDDDALSPSRQRDAGTWMEVCVADVTAARTAITAAGAEIVPHTDPEHTYYQAPGGQFFRLAR